MRDVGCILLCEGRPSTVLKKRFMSPVDDITQDNLIARVVDHDRGKLSFVKGGCMGLWR
jgi:hypothetical protein